MRGHMRMGTGELRIADFGLRMGWGVTAVVVAGLLGCERGGPAVTSAPSTPVETATAPATTEPAATEPGDDEAITPASQPVAALPPSRYTAEPPYLVELHVRSAEDEQPGWLRIIALADEKAPASATGTFPEQNRLQVDTRNVRRLRIHLDHLPRDASRRTFLRIDEQAIELLRKNRDYVHLERRPTGEWLVTPEADD